jgi:YD repeat-containing protein
VISSLASPRNLAVFAAILSYGLLAPQAQGTRGGADQVYDEDGRITIERTMLEGGAIREIRYSYDAGRLIAVQTLLDGTVERTVSYLYAPDGRLVMARASDDGTSGLTRIESGASTSWLVSSDGLEMRDYDIDGRLITITRFHQSILVSREERAWKEGTVQRSETTLPDGTVTTNEYQTDGPARGLLVSTSSRNGSAAISDERRIYDDEGHLVELRRQNSLDLELTQYTYDQGGALISERISTGNTPSTLALAITRTYEGPTTYVEESYDAGTLFARVRYEDGRRVSEDILRDGVVIRTRQFP